MKMKALWIAAAAVAAAGCGTIQQKVDPVRAVPDKEICVVRDVSSREGFLDSYQKALERKGFRVTVVPEYDTRNCPLLTTYRARWGMGFASPTLSYVDLRVIKDSVTVGTALYNSTSARSIEKIINADSKINELVDQLFPGR
jgi:hypothetical protein